MLYIVWQTSNTPDSYYSCSDLVFKSAPAAVKTSPAATKAAVKKTAPASSAPATPTRAATSEAAVAAATEAATTEPPAAQSLTPVSDETKVTLGHEIVIGGVVLAAAALAIAGFGRLRRNRFENR
jgi:chitin-binding protein